MIWYLLRMALSEPQCEQGELRVEGCRTRAAGLAGVTEG